jgi:hypothetical protein
MEGEHFREWKGGLNQMSIARFESLVEQSPLPIEGPEAAPHRPAPGRLKFR